MENLDHIHRIIEEALRSNIDILPADRKEWVMYCCALKVLGYDESTFVALSNCPGKVSRSVWRNERNPQRYIRSEEQAAKKIWYFAEAAGMNPKQFLLPIKDKQNHRRDTSTRPKPREIMQPTPILPPIYISSEQISIAEKRNKETSLFAYLCRYFTPADVSRVFACYHVGASRYTNPQGGRAVAFPYINTDGLCMDVKVMSIDPTTGSRKTAPPLYVRQNGEPTGECYYLGKIGKSDRRAPWCNFGDHLLTQRPNDPVAIVESEKTAVICSLVYPEFIWLAVGSKSNLNAERLSPCRHRQITIFPDRDGYNDKPRKDGKGIEPGWRSIAKKLTEQGFIFRVDTTTERHPGENNDDIADIVLRCMMGKQTPPESTQTADEISPDKAEVMRVWNQWKQECPHLCELEKKLDLIPVRVVKNYAI